MADNMNQLSNSLKLKARLIKVRWHRAKVIVMKVILIIIEEVTMIEEGEAEGVVEVRIQAINAR